MGDEELMHAINKLERTTRRSNNLGWAVLRGIFYSFGWIIGLAIIATILFYLLPKTGESNFIGKFIHAMSNALRQNK